MLEHSASRYEAETRGIDLVVYEGFEVIAALSALHSVIAWAYMTTSPIGLTVTVEERLEEIGVQQDLQFHDLRHAANHVAVVSGASTRELMGRMGHASKRAA